MGAYYQQRVRGCGCARCRCSGLIGPAVLITLGVLILLDQFNVFHFHSTWPVILIVIGALKVFQSSASREGHIGPGAPPPIYPYTGPAATPPSEVTPPGTGQVNNG